MEKSSSFLEKSSSFFGEVVFIFRDISVSWVLIFLEKSSSFFENILFIFLRGSLHFCWGRIHFLVHVVFIFWFRSSSFYLLSRLTFLEEIVFILHFLGDVIFIFWVRSSSSFKRLGLHQQAFKTRLISIVLKPIVFVFVFVWFGWVKLH